VSCICSLRKRHDINYCYLVQDFGLMVHPRFLGQSMPDCLTEEKIKENQVGNLPVFNEMQNERLVECLDEYCDV